jgi:hypothetical protein
MLNPMNFGCVNQHGVIFELINYRSFGGYLPTPFDVILAPKCGLVENPIVAPSNSTQVITPSTANGVLGSVTVLKQTPAYYTTTISGTASDSVTITGAVKVSSSDTAVATVTVANNVVTITGVAPGVAAISVFNAAGELIATVYTTVTA